MALNTDDLQPVCLGGVGEKKGAGGSIFDVAEDVAGGKSWAMLVALDRAGAPHLGYPGAARGTQRSDPARDQRYNPVKRLEAAGTQTAGEVGTKSASLVEVGRKPLHEWQTERG
jgi:hypothetical protein